MCLKYPPLSDNEIFLSPLSFLTFLSSANNWPIFFRRWNISICWAILSVMKPIWEKKSFSFPHCAFFFTVLEAKWNVKLPKQLTILLASMENLTPRWISYLPFSFFNFLACIPSTQTIFFRWHSLLFLFVFFTLNLILKFYMFHVHSCCY